jgi:hypothetical protein
MMPIPLMLLWLLWVAQAPPGKLALVQPVIHQFEDGPPIAYGQEFIPGETVFFSVRVRGFQTSKEQTVRLAYRFDAVDAGNVRLVETKVGRIETELSLQDKDWVPILRFNFIIPPHAEAGTYRILTSVKDELSGSEAQITAPFEVRGYKVAPSSALVVRNFRFLRSEEDSSPLVEATYRAGSSLWARYDITGFKIGENNRISVQSQISILNSEGKVLYTQPEPASEQDSPFYPKRYVTEVFRLNIQPGTPVGEYSVLLTVKDLVGQQTFQGKYGFRIE